jgi:hypothetical protein
MKVATFLKYASHVTAEHPELRIGQAYFNSLYSLDPEAAERIRGTDTDPFYNDGVIPKFLGYLKEMIAKDKVDQIDPHSM